MTHSHTSCARPTGEGVVCTDGVLTGYCGEDACHNEYCSPYGHCRCRCHDGKTCDCGHTWPRQPRKIKERKTS